MVLPLLGRFMPLRTNAVVAVGEADAGTGHKFSRRAKKQPRRDVVHALGKTVRLRDKDHRKFVLRQPCLVCGRVPSDPHHLTFTQPRALGRRVSDEFTVPVCRLHHRELHRSGDEAAWWRSLNIDPLPVALKLWQQTRSDSELAPIPQAQAVMAAETLAPDQARMSRGASHKSGARAFKKAGRAHLQGSGTNAFQARGARDFRIS